MDFSVKRVLLLKQHITTHNLRFFRGCIRMKRFMLWLISALIMLCLLAPVAGASDEGTIQIVDCSTLDGLTDHTGIQGVSDIDVGDGVARIGWDSEWTDSSATITATFKPVDISSCAGGSVKLFYNNFNISALGTFELTDGENSFRWDLSKFGVGNVNLPFDMAETVGGTPDLSRICGITITNDTIHIVLSKVEASPKPYRVAFNKDKYAKELEQAAALGLFPPEWDDDLSYPVGVGEFAQLASQAVEKASGTRIQVCENTDDCYMCSLGDRPGFATRDVASQILILNSMEAYHSFEHGSWFSDPWEICTLNMDMAQIPIHQPYPPILEHDLAMEGKLDAPYSYQGAIYCAIQCDTTSGRTIMETDAEGWLRTGDFMSRGEAILAAKRLYYAYKATSFEESAYENLAVISRADLTIIKDPAEESASAESLLMDYEIEEWQLALALGIVPEGFDTSGFVTPHEFMNMLERTVALAGGDMTPLRSRLYDDWDKRDAVIRMDAAIAYILAAEGMDINIAIPNRISAWSFMQTEDMLRSNSSQMFNILNDVRRMTYSVDVTYDNMYSITEYYVERACGQASFVSAHPIMTVTEDAHFRFGNALTRKDAILGCWRLYTSKEPESDYMTPDEVGLNSHTIDPALLSKSSELPPITKESFPVLAAAHDIHQYSSAYVGCDRYLSEDEVKTYKLAGVECLALPFAFNLFEYPDFTPGQVNRWRLEDLDRVIALCIKYDIHLILDCNAFPGCGGVPLGIYHGELGYLERHAFMFTDRPDIMALLRDYWLMLARRYANVPTQYLSFYLLHEEGFEVDQAHADFFTQLIDDIRVYNPDRIIGLSMAQDYAYSDADARFGINTDFDRDMLEMGLKNIAEKKTSMFVSYYNHGIENLVRPWGVRKDIQYPMYDFMEAYEDGDDKDPLTIYSEKGITEFTVTATSVSDTPTDNQYGYDMLFNEKPAKDDAYTEYASEAYNEVPNDNTLSRKVKLNSPINSLALPVAKHCGIRVIAIELTLEDGSVKCLNSIPYPYINHSESTEIHVDASNTTTTAFMYDAQYFYDLFLAPYKEFADKQNVSMVIEEYGTSNAVLYHLHKDALTKWYTEMMRIANENGITIFAGWVNKEGGEHGGQTAIAWYYADMYGEDEHGRPIAYDRTGTSIVKVPGTYGIWLDMNAAELLWGNIDESRAIAEQRAAEHAK